MTESREYMLSVLWRSLDPDKKVTFRDGSEHYFLPRIKMEKISDKKYELLDTTRDVYKPLEGFLVQFAYENSLKIHLRALPPYISHPTSYNPQEFGGLNLHIVYNKKLHLFVYQACYIL